MTWLKDFFRGMWHRFWFPEEHKWTPDEIEEYDEWK